MNIATIPFTSLRYVDTKSTEICCWNAVSGTGTFCFANLSPALLLT